MIYNFTSTELSELIADAVESGVRQALDKPVSEWLSANQVAEMMGYTDSRTVRQNIASGKWDIVWKKKGKYYQFKRKSVEKYIQLNIVR